MAERVTPRRRGSYGIDAPFAPAFLAGLAILYLVLAIVTGKGMFWAALCFILACEAFYLHGTLRGKFVLWAELLDRLSLRGDERILDVRSTGQYQAELTKLTKLGMNDVARSRLGWWSWPARLVTATKPQTGN